MTTLLAQDSVDISGLGWPLDQWPDTVLEWTFRWAPVEGIRLRRRHRLFDELGRIGHPEDIATYLMEDLETRPLPPLSTARDGFGDL